LSGSSLPRFPACTQERKSSCRPIIESSGDIRTVMKNEAVLARIARTLNGNETNAVLVRTASEQGRAVLERKSLVVII
jgi:hypothetical protein